MLRSERQTDVAPRPVLVGALRDQSFELSAIPTFMIRVEDGPVFRMFAVNRALERLTGLVASEMEGRTPYEFLPERTADTVVANYLKCFVSAESYTYDEILHLPFGEQWFRTVLTPVTGDEGHVEILIGQATEITDLMAESFEKTDALVKIKQKNEDFSRLLPLLAHDFRGPTGEVRAAIDIILEGFVDLGDGKRQMLEASRKTLDHMSAQFDHLLVYCDAIGSDVPNLQRMVCFDHICRDVIALIDPDSEKSISFPQGRNFRGDPVMVQVILRNLIANAVRYSCKRIAIDVSQVADTVTLVIEDDGPGFQQDMLLRLNSTAYRADTSSGHGFGLEAVRHLTHRVGGNVEFTNSRVLGGGAIRVRIPDTAKKAA